MSTKTTHYYVPTQSIWPAVAAVSLFTLAIGTANFIQQSDAATSGNTGTYGWLIFLAGLLSVLSVMFFWFGETIKESMAGMNSRQMDISYRMGMMWFIFSEVMFFAAFFGTLFYARWLSVPWLAGEGKGVMTHELLWPDFQAMWPLTATPDGRTVEPMGPFPLPLLNTLLLITSGIFLTIAHHALKANNRAKLIINLFITVVLGFTFLGVQAYEYHHAYTEMGLTLHAGMYGTTFFMLTGFHGLHVTIGAIMLTVMLVRSMKGHFTPNEHFAFEAAAWYWHFVDVVWIFLFFVVYWL